MYGLDEWVDGGIIPPKLIGWPLSLAPARLEACPGNVLATFEGAGGGKAPIWGAESLGCAV